MRIAVLKELQCFAFGSLEICTSSFVCVYIEGADQWSYLESVNAAEIVMDKDIGV